MITHILGSTAHRSCSNPTYHLQRILTDGLRKRNYAEIRYFARKTCKILSKNKEIFEFTLFF